MDRLERIKRMDRKSAFMIFFIVIFALVLLILLFKLNSAWNQKQYRVLIATAPLQRGSILSTDKLAWKEYPPKQIQSSYFTQNRSTPADVVGGVVIHNVAAGEPITRSNVLAPNATVDYRALLQPNMRALMLPIEGVGSGFLRSGDYVDILLTFDAATLGPPAPASNPHHAIVKLITKTLFKNVLILGVYPLDQSGGGQTRVGTLLSAADRGPARNNVKWITFELTPKQAEMMASANTMGQVTLSMEGTVVGQVMEGQSYTTNYYVAGFSQSPAVTLIQGSTKEVIYLGR